MPIDWGIGARIVASSCCLRHRDGRQTRTRRTSCWRLSNSHRQLGGSVRLIQILLAAVRASSVLLFVRAPHCGLLLSPSCSVRRIAACGDILDPDCDDVTATKLAVDRKIKHDRRSGVWFGSTRGVWVAEAALHRSPCLCSKATVSASCLLDFAWTYSSVYGERGASATG